MRLPAFTACWQLRSSWPCARGAAAADGPLTRHDEAFARMDTDWRTTVTARATCHVVAGPALDVAGCLTGRMASPSVAGYVDGCRQYSRCRVAFDGNGGRRQRARHCVRVSDQSGTRRSPPTGTSACLDPPALRLIAGRTRC